MTDQPDLVYLDASALVKLVVAEAETAALRTYLTQHSHCATSVLARVEVARALGRVGVDRQARLEAVFEGLIVVELTDDIVARARRVGPSTLRTLDAIHVATALELSADLTAFLTYDGRLVDAARALGIAIAAPA
ncbi:MAG: type II toxin-antitoxin system VapC family toxin [Candidatus Limnocylindrales bacterium]